MKRLFKDVLSGHRRKRGSLRRKRRHLIENLESRKLLTATLSISDATVDESTGTATFTITLDNPTSDATVNWSTSNGTASSSSDYTASSGTATIYSFDPTTTISVPITSDSLKESDETFYVSLSSPTGATIADGIGVGKIEDDDAEGLTRFFERFYAGGDVLHAGNVKSEYMMQDGSSLIYNSLGNGDLILDLRTIQPDDSSVPSQIKAELIFNGASNQTIYYSTTGLSAGDELRFVFDVDSSALSSGVYEFELALTETIGSDFSYRNLIGYTGIQKRTDSYFGNGWMLGGLDYLSVQTDWVAVHFSDGATGFYDRDSIQAGGGGGGPGLPGGGGGSSDSRLIENTDGTFTLSSKYGSEAKFDSSGKLLHRKDKNDNKTTYSYLTGGEIDEIVFQDGRTISFSYDTNGNVDEIEDNAGRITAFSIDSSGFLNTISAPDPDGAGSLSAPQTHYYYNSSNDILEEIEDALGNSTTYSFDGFNRVSGIANALSQSYSVSPQLVNGLVGSGSGTSGNPASLPSTTPSGSVTDPLSHTESKSFDVYGLPLSYTDALSNTTLWERNDDGYVTKLTLPDPDGAGSLTAPVTVYELDDDNNVTKITYPDATYVTTTYDATWNVPTQHIDAMGHKTVFTVNSSNGNVTQIRRVVGQVDDSFNMETDDIVTDLTYTSDPTANGQLFGGLVSTITDPNGIISQRNYGTTAGNNFARLTSVVAAYGTSLAATTAFTYDAAGNVLSITDPESRETQFEYDSLGRLIETTYPDPDGAGSEASAVLAYSYDTGSNLTTLTDALGKDTTFAYDALNRLTTTTYPDPDGVGSLSSLTEINAYDSAGRLSTFTDTLGGVTTYGYDNANRVTSITFADPDGGGSLTSPVISYSYDNIGRLASETDPLGNVTSYSYNVMSQLVQMTLPDPDGAGSLTSPIWNWDYNDIGQVVTETNPLAGETDYTYNALSQLVTIEFPDPDGAGSMARQEINYAFDKIGNRTGVTAPDGSTTLYDFDDLNRLIEITLPNPGGMGPPPSSTIEFAYDLVGQLETRTDMRGQDTEYAYDNAGRLVTVTAPDPDGAGSQASPVSSYTYDTAGQLLEMTDPLGNVTTYEYDDMRRLIERTDPDPDGVGSLSSPVTQYSFGSNGLLASLTDASGNTTSWTYDNLGRAISETNELSDTKSYVYDAANQLTKYTDRNGRVTEFGYDNLGRLTSELWKSGSTTVRTLSYAYDALSRQTSASDPDAAYDFTYDAVGRVTQLDVDYGTSVNEFRLSSTFDDYGNRDTLSLSVDSGSGFVADLLNEYDFDGMNRVISIVQKGQSGGAAVADKRVDIAYTSDSLFAQITRYASQTASSGSLVAESTYNYDDMGRLLGLDHDHNTTSIASYDFTYDAFSRISEIVATSSTGLSGTTDFTYDDLGQLIDVDHTHITDESYEFDATGNRTTSGYSTGDANRLTSDGTFNYVYDDEGNLVTRTRISSTSADDYTTEYEWDYRNRLTAITFKNNAGTSTKAVEYTYDIFNRRISKSIDADGAGSGTAAVSWFVYDAGDILVSTDAGGDIETRYLHGPAVDQVFAAEDASTGDTLWALTDHLGSVRDIVDDSGAVENHIVYDSFGNIVSETAPAVDFIFGFTGRERDEESGLNYHRARYYDSTIGRWISEDPISFTGGDENIYRYIGNNSPNGIDPTGLAWVAPPNANSTGSFEREIDRKKEEDTWVDSYYIPWLHMQSQVFGTLSQVIDPFNVHSQIQEGTEDLITVLENGKHLPTPHRLYVGVGTSVGTMVGVRGLSDAFSEHDAVDAHKQTTTEKVVDGVTGGISLLTTAAGITPSAVKVTPGGGKAYSVAFEANLPKSMYPGVSAQKHFQEANRQLLSYLKVDTKFANMIEELIPNIQTTLVRPRSISRNPPKDWTWHHHPDKPGVLQLVPFEQHYSPLLWTIFHPGNKGGMHNWGGGYK